jgi:hypothetical protein
MQKNGPPEGGRDGSWQAPSTPELGHGRPTPPSPDYARCSLLNGHQRTRPRRIVRAKAVSYTAKILLFEARSRPNWGMGGPKPRSPIYKGRVLRAEPFQGEHHRADETGWIETLFEGAAQLARNALHDQRRTESAPCR